jgi:hypothetical protein
MEYRDDEEYWLRQYESRSAIKRRMVEEQQPAAPAPKPKDGYTRRGNHSEPTVSQERRHANYQTQIARLGIKKQLAPGCFWIQPSKYYYD